MILVGERRLVSVIESFRNELWPDYKSGEGIEPDLLSQFPPLKDTLPAAGVVVRPMIEFEADDALAAVAVAAAEGQAGRIRVESKLDIGSTFYFTWPGIKGE
jgi:hypothetical protein